MSDQFKKVLIAIGIPLGIMLLSLLMNNDFLAAGILALLVPFVYLVVGIILLFTSRKSLGQALLIAAGIIFLIGFSVCTIMLNSTNFH